MELTREKIRLLLMHEYLAGLNAAKATERINDAWGSGTVGRQTAYDWFAKFKAGEDNLNDQPRSGRPKEVDRQAVLEAIEEHPSLTCRMLADDFDCSPQTIANILH